MLDNPVRIGVLVSGGGTNLQALIDAQKNGIIKNGNIELVISNNEDAYALTRAKENNIKTRVICKKSFNSNADFEEQLIAHLEDSKVELIVLAGFMCILSKDFTDHFKNKIINVHPALIPSFCGEGFYGLKVHEAALEKGVKVTGATVHYVNEIPDGGKIIAQKAVEINDDDTAQTLQKRVMEQAEWIILPQAVEKVCKEIKNK